MAHVYVNSGATGLNNGTSWANAYTTLNAATSVATGADIVWVKNTHAETAAAAKSITFPTSPGLRVICTSDATEPPTSSTTGAKVITTGNFSVALVSGFAYVYGVEFDSGTGNSGAADLLVASGNADTHIVLDNCTLAVLSTHLNAPIVLGASAGGGSTTNRRVDFIDCTLRQDTSAISAMIVLQTGFWNFSGMTIAGAGATPPTSLFETASAQSASSLLVENSDLTGRALTNLVDLTNFNSPPNRFVIRNCKLPTGVNVTTGSFDSSGASIVEMHNCDSADTHIRFSRNSWQGSVTQQTGTRIRTGGATQADSTAFSWLMAGSANSVYIAHPLVSPDIAIFNTTVGSSITATVEILHDSVTNLQNDKIWLEVDYPGTTGFPQSNRASDRVATVIATPADQDASSVAWDTTGMTNPNKQKLVVTFTPQEAGYILCRVKLAANVSVYVDPLITLA